MSKIKIDWDASFRWIENGYLTGDIAMLYGMDVSSVARRARQEMDPARYAEWKRLNGINRRALMYPEDKKAPCGTPAAYMRHRRDNEPIDEDCRLAHAKASKDYRERVKASRKRSPRRVR
jgi:hypothetical protein